MKTETKDRLVSALTRTASAVRGQRAVPPEVIGRIAAEAGHDKLDEATGAKVAGLLEMILGKPDEDRKPCLMYPGGKCRMRHHIVGLMPKHRVYVEVFGGCGAVLLAKPRAEVEIWNDISPYQFGMVKTLQDAALTRRLERRMAEELNRPGALVRKFLAHREWARVGKKLPEKENDPVERTLAMLGALVLYSTPIDADKLKVSGASLNYRLNQWRGYVSKLLSIPAFSARLTGVQAYNVDWKRLIRLVDEAASMRKWKPSEVLFYLDPPYVEETITDGFNGQYGKPGESFDEAEHEALVKWMTKTPARVMLSGRPHESGAISLLDRHRRIVRHDFPFWTRGLKWGSESVWCNFRS